MTSPNTRHGKRLPLRRVALSVTAAGALLGGIALAAPTASAMSHGTEVARGTFPWMATLALTGKGSLEQRGYCGGTLISPTRVLTAGHCVDHKSPDDFTVHLGADKLSATAGPAHSVRGITPAKIVSPGEVAAAKSRHATGVTYGHGVTEHSDMKKAKLTDRLQRARMTILPRKQCSSHIPKDAVGPGYCVTGKPAPPTAKTPSICGGDSGGPLMLPTAGGPKVAGVVSAQSNDGGCDGSVHQGQYANRAGWRDQALRPHPTLAPTGTVRATGSPKVGETLHGAASVHTPGPVTVHYQWRREKIVEGKGDFTYFDPVKDGDTQNLAVPSKAAGRPLKLTATLSNQAGSVRIDKTTADVHR